MVNNEKNSVKVELYDLALTQKKDERFGRVIKTKSLSEEDLVNIAISRRTDLNASTLKAAIDILKDIAIEEVTNGANVNFGLGYFSLGVSGVFIGDNAKWDNAKHKLSVNVTPSNELRKSIKSCKPDVRGMASTGISINYVEDVISGEKNICLTKGGGIKISGNRMKIAGNEQKVGLRLINQTTKEEIKMPITSVLVNTPSEIVFIAPADLPAADYQLSISTQFSGSTILLKNIKSYTFDYILTVV